jgi:hypothetical protein
MPFVFLDGGVSISRKAGGRCLSLLFVKEIPAYTKTLRHSRSFESNALFLQIVMIAFKSLVSGLS